MTTQQPTLERISAFCTAYGFPEDNLEATDHSGLTPLMRAAREGAVETMVSLLEAGVDLHRENADGNTALWLACVSGQPAAVRALVAAGANIDHRNLTGATVLMYAASSGKPLIVDLLLSLGADPHTRNQDDAKAIDMVADIQSLKLLRFSADS